MRKVCEQTTYDQPNQPKDQPTLTQKRKRAAANRKARENAMKSLGLTKVKGGLGTTFWE